MAVKISLAKITDIVRILGKHVTIVTVLLDGPIHIVIPVSAIKLLIINQI